jgi:hypothetical protein
MQRFTPPTIIIVLLAMLASPAVVQVKKTPSVV